MDQAPAHSPIGASSYHRWKNCPGSVRLSRDVPRVDTEYADEGTLAHDLAARMLAAMQNRTPMPETLGYEDEMLQAVDFYVDHVWRHRTLANDRTYDLRQLYEHRFDLTDIHPLCFGTADCVTYIRSKKLLIVSDLKYGAGVFVDAVRNDQLMYYALGALKSLQKEFGFAIHEVRVEIIQPRITFAEAVRPWSCDIFDLLEFEDQLRADAAATDKPDAPLCAGDWCTFCPAVAVCPLLRVMSKVIVQNDTDKPTTEQLAEDLKWAPILETALRRKREMAYALAEKGKKIPGWKLVKKQGRRDWDDPDDAAFELRLAGFKADHILQPPAPQVMLSPSQIEKLPLKGIPFKSRNELKEFVAKLTTTKSSGNKLVPQDHAGVEVKVMTPETAFPSGPDTIAGLNCLN